MTPKWRDGVRFAKSRYIQIIKAAIPIWLPFYREHFGLKQNSSAEEKLRSVSASTIARLLKRDLGLRGVSTTKPNKQMKALIPLKRLDEEVNKPGTIQVVLTHKSTRTPTCSTLNTTNVINSSSVLSSTKTHYHIPYKTIIGKGYWVA